MKRIEKGSVVKALVKLTETGFRRPGREHTHARPGDTGRVELLRTPGLALVRWERTGTACDCHVSELELRAIRRAA